jgi:hypothetical protein
MTLGGRIKRLEQEHGVSQPEESERSQLLKKLAWAEISTKEKLGIIEANERGEDFQAPNARLQGKLQRAYEHADKKFPDERDLSALRAALSEANERKEQDRREEVRNYWATFVPSPSRAEKAR